MKLSHLAAFVTICSSTLGVVVETTSFLAASKAASRSVVASNDRILQDCGFVEHPHPFPSSGLVSAFPDFFIPARVTEEADPARTTAEEDSADMAEWND